MLLFRCFLVFTKVNLLSLNYLFTFVTLNTTHTIYNGKHRRFH